MSFVLNDVNTQQLSFFDSYNTLTKREKLFLNKSWAKYFGDHIFPKIDERPFAVLYSNKDSRPNTPVNVNIGALIIKEYTGMSDDELLTSLMFDIRFQYALHTTSFEEQPMSDRSLGRFRERCRIYEEETGIDLLYPVIIALSNEMAEMMKLDMSLKRMDSLMVASNIKKMSRLELLYTCMANLARDVAKTGCDLPESLQHYIQADDRNRIIYHNRSEDTSEKISTVLKDAITLKNLCGTDFDNSSNYLLLIRVLKEQTISDEEGKLRLKTKEDGEMDATILQNPSDPDATYREKAGRQHRGYVANVTEIAGENGSIVTDYQLENNTYSDSQFLQNSLERMGKQEEQVTIVTDGAYAGKKAAGLAEENNVNLVHTSLTGRETEDILADFEFNEAGNKVIRCPGGHEPKSCSHNPSTGQCAVSFHKSQCEQCPYRKQCRPKMFKRVSRKTVSINAKQRAQQQRDRNTEEFKKMSRFRNGVETIPSILRRKYQIDRMPVRGLKRERFWFGCKIGALNFRKFCKYMQGLESCTQNVATD